MENIDCFLIFILQMYVHFKIHIREKRSFKQTFLLQKLKLLFELEASR